MKRVIGPVQFSKQYVPLLGVTISLGLTVDVRAIEIVLPLLRRLNRMKDELGATKHIMRRLSICLVVLVGHSSNLVLVLVMKNPSNFIIMQQLVISTKK